MHAVPHPGVVGENKCGLRLTVKVQASPGWLIMCQYMWNESGPQGPCQRVGMGFNRCLNMAQSCVRLESGPTLSWIFIFLFNSCLCARKLWTSATYLQRSWHGIQCHRGVQGPSGFEWVVEFLWSKYYYFRSNSNANQVEAHHSAQTTCNNQTMKSKW